MGVEASAESERLEGSFRDPAGYVFLREGNVYRAINEECHGVLDGLAKTGALQSLIERRLIVETRWLDEAGAATLGAEHEGYARFLEHERLPHITFPYEWSFSMLADAALLTLDLQIELLGHGLSLKDATAYNVQFSNGRPLFIDLGSFERPRRFDLWFAMGQFQRHFLFPLLLMRHRGWDLRSYFLANIDGLPPQRVAEAFPGFSRWSPKLLLDVTLPIFFERKAQGAKTNWEDSGKAAAASSKGQIVNLQRLRRKIDGLAQGYKTQGAWHDYTATCTYDQQATASKKAHIEAFLKGAAPASVLDLGCNTGEYSRLAAASGAEVIAADADHDAIELLYRNLRENPAKITPMAVNLSNPSPAIGYMNVERRSFIDRSRSDCVFALALIHHLLVSANLSLPAIRDLFAALTRRHLVLEYVPVEDGQFQRIIRFRENLFASVTLETCLEVFATRFDLLEKRPVAGTERTLLFFELRC